MSSYVVTGAAHGIGFEFVNQLSSSSDNIVFGLVRNKKTADKLVALSRPNLHVLEADITDVQALKLAAQEVSKVTGGKLNVLINNAAYERRNGPALDGYPEGKEELLEEDLRTNFDVNVIGTIHATNTFLPLLLTGLMQSEIRKVISISTPIADIGFTLATENTNFVPYSISKAAVNVAMAKYAVEHKKNGFAFLSISPGLVNTKGPNLKPSEEELAKSKAMVASSLKAYPNFSGAITPQQSVELMLNIMDKTTLEDTDAFISHKGNNEWL